MFTESPLPLNLLGKDKVNVYAYMKLDKWQVSSGSESLYEIMYRDVTFDLIIIGN